MGVCRGNCCRPTRKVLGSPRVNVPGPSCTWAEDKLKCKWEAYNIL